MSNTQSYKCIKPQCHPAKCTDCSCAIAPSDDAAHLVLDLLNTFAVDGMEAPFEDGDSQLVDRARYWLQNRRAPGQCLHQISEPPKPIAEICSASHDDAEFGERSIKPLGDLSAYEYGTKLYAAPDDALDEAPGERDAAFEAVRQRLCKVPRWSFHLDARGNIRRVGDASGNWIEFSAAHELLDPAAVDATISAQAEEGEAA